MDITRTNGTECVYLIYGKEVASTGTPHLQGYVRFRTLHTLSGVRKLFPTSHLEPAKGDVIQNVTYCSKEGDVFEKGIRPVAQKEKGEGERDRWKRNLDAARSGDLESVDPDIYLRFYRTLKEIAKDSMARPPDAEDVNGLWIYGPSGCGKSRRARELAPNAYFKMANKWWDGYQNEEDVILDDLDKTHECLGHKLKIWADRYAFIGETKGGALFIRPKNILVTSQYSIEEIFPDDETREALNRRFKKIKFTV